MEKVFPFESPRKHYRNEFADFFCPDQRFDDAFVAFRKQFHNPDPIVLPGGVKALVDSGPEVQRYLLSAIVLLREAHGFSTLRLWTHNECTACGGSVNKEFYVEMLRKGKEIIARAIPDLKVELWFADFDGFYRI